MLSQPSVATPASVPFSTSSPDGSKQKLSCSCLLWRISEDVVRSLACRKHRFEVGFSGQQRVAASASLVCRHLLLSPPLPLSIAQPEMRLSSGTSSPYDSLAQDLDGYTCRLCCCSFGSSVLHIYGRKPSVDVPASSLF